MTEFWDRQGQPLELMEWAQKYEDTAYRNVAVDIEGDLMVSTIWEGMNSPLTLYPETLPRGIFETALLIDGHIQWKRRHSTEQDALKFHRETVVFHMHREPDNGEVRQEILRREAEKRAAQRIDRGQ